MHFGPICYSPSIKPLELILQADRSTLEVGGQKLLTSLRSSDRLRSRGGTQGLQLTVQSLLPSPLLSPVPRAQDLHPGTGKEVQLKKKCVSTCFFFNAPSESLGYQSV